MKLVTYDDGKVGYVDGEEVVRVDVADLAVVVGDELHRFPHPTWS